MKWKAFIERLRADLPQHASHVDADEIWRGIEPAVDAINMQRGRRRWNGWLPLLILAGVLLIGGGTYLAVERTANGGSNDAVTGINSPTGNSNALTGNTTERTPGAGQAGVKSEAGGKEYGTASGTVEMGSASKNAEAAEAPGHDAGTRNSAAESAILNWNAASREAIRDVKKGSESDGDGNQNSSYSGQAGPKIQKSKKGGLAPEINMAISEDHLAVANPGHMPPASAHSSGADGYEGGQLSPVSGSRTDLQPGIDWNAGVLTASMERHAAFLLGDYSLLTGQDAALNMSAYERKANPSTDCPSFGRTSGLSFLVGFHGGAAYPFRKMTSSEEGEELLILRDETEKSLVSGNYGLDFMLRHSSGFEASTGVQSMTLLERFDISRTLTTTETEYGIQAISINLLGDTVYIMGDIPVTTTTTERKRYYNKYKFVEIPIIIGYSRAIGDLRVGGEAGVIAGILTKTEGKILDVNEEFTDIDDANPAVNGSTFGMSYYFGASLVYAYESGIELGIHPHVRYSPSDHSAEEYPVKSKYIMAGANISLRYRFGGK